MISTREVETMTKLEQALELLKQAEKILGEADDTNHTRETEQAYIYVADYAVPIVELAIRNDQPKAKLNRTVESFDGHLVGRTL